MIYYAIKDNQLLDEVSENKTALEMSLQANGHTEYELYSTEYEDFTPSNLKYTVDLTTFKVGLNPEYNIILAERERERIAMLKMTPRDFLLAITSMGIEWAQIKELMAQNPQVEIELNYCQYVYRGNPLLDDLCGNFGVTPEQLDELFLAHENISLTTSQ